MAYLKSILAFFALGSFLYAGAQNKDVNVLFIAVDDMADWVGYMGGHPDAITPNIDRLANRGTAFMNTYVASPVCGPSRAAVLTGLRPETTGVYSNNVTDYQTLLKGVRDAKNQGIPVRSSVKEATPMPIHFKNNGYHTMGAGKLFHPMNNVVPEAFHEFGPEVGALGSPFPEEQILTENMPMAIDLGNGRKAHLPMNGGISVKDRSEMKWNSFDWGPVDVSDDQMPGGKMANWAVERLNKTYERPFFLAVGFYKPHQPLYAPRKYFEMYDIDNMALPATIAGDMFDIPEAGKQFASAAWSAGTHKTVVKEKQWKEGVLGYLATITFVDAQIGKILDALDNSPYARNTIIVFWSDHGWHLGEKEHWGKYDPWMESIKVPFVIVPSISDKSLGQRNGQKVKSQVNLLDIYPTLIDMCGLPNKNNLQGHSLYPLLQNPDLAWNPPSVTTIGQGTQSIVKDSWSYIHYYDGSEELYNLSKDPNQWINLVGDEKYNDKITQMKSFLIEDPLIERYIRYGDWKAVRTIQGKWSLFDFSEKFGISENYDRAAENPKIIKEITTYLKQHPETGKYADIPTDHLSKKK